MSIFSRLFNGDSTPPPAQEAGEPSASEAEAAAVPRPPLGSDQLPPGSPGPIRAAQGQPPRPQDAGAALPPLVLDSDFPAPAEQPPPSAAQPGAAELDDDLWELASELEARFDASRKRTDPPEVPKTEPTPDSVTTEQDLAAIRDLFNEMAVHHMAQVRDLMLELGRVEVATTWLGLCEPAVQSMRKMCEKLELPELSQALDDFTGCLVAAKSAPTGLVQGETRERLLATYARMMEVLPSAFELGSGREAMLVQLLLLQVPGVHKLTLDKLYAAGLHQLDAFLNARPDELAAVAGIRLSLAENIARHFREYRQSFHSVLAEAVPGEERRRLAELVERLHREHGDFERAAAGWSPEAHEEKRRLREDRRNTLSAIYVSLARLGETERVDALQKKPVGRQLEELEAYLRKAASCVT